MRKQFSKTACIVISATTALASHNAAAAEKTDPVAVLARDQVAFAVDLYRHLAEQKQGNLFFSPYSISTALAMTRAGARGETAREMTKTLRFSLADDPLHGAIAAMQTRLTRAGRSDGIELDIANSLWPQAEYPFLKDYMALLKKSFGAESEALDYSQNPERARKRINEWTARKTRNKIEDLIPQGVLDPMTRLVLANAIYFKGEWASAFDRRNTRPLPFHSAPKTTVKTPTMQTKRSFGYAEFDDLQVLAMPYKGRAYSMIVLLPRTVAGLAEIEKSLTAQQIDQWTAALREQEVQVWLPRFQATSQLRLDRVLQSMGMPLAFDPNKADFSGMDGREPWLYIGAVLHKAFVEVNEEGAEAAAATAVVMAMRSFRPPTVFRAERPFLFLIRANESGALLFMGRMVNPAANP